VYWSGGAPYARLDLAAGHSEKMRTFTPTKSQRLASAFLALTLGAALGGISCGGRAERIGGGGGAVGAGGSGWAGAAPPTGGGGVASGAVAGASGASSSSADSGGAADLEWAGASGSDAGSAGSPTVIHGPGGTTIITTSGGPPILEMDCANIPASVFATQLGPCLSVTATSNSAGSFQVCYPNPNHLLGSIVECAASSVGTARCATASSRLYAGKCCTALSLIPGQMYGPINETIDPICATAQLFGTIAAGVLADTDGDFTPDVVDDCPAVSDLQSDKDGDGVGDTCDNCAKAYNPDQADRNHDGVGDACDGGAIGAAGAGGSGGAGG